MLLDWDAHMMGISFHTPLALLNGKEPLEPAAADVDIKSESFLWQAPNSEATLFMGEKWVELHGFISEILDKLATSSAPVLVPQKELSTKHPVWLEFVLQLSRARGYYTLYPGVETSNTILGIHEDLREPPEEYQGEEAEEDTALDPEETFDSTSQVNMLLTLPQGGALPLLNDLPILSWDGKKVTPEEFSRGAAAYTQRFRVEVGQCPVGEKLRPVDARASDLFCETVGKGV